MQQVVIVGGGISGLICSYLLRKAGLNVLVIEKYSYPFHRVCGEYVSNEVQPFLQKNELLPQKLELPNISKFILTSVSGKKAETDLDLGGFGISRYTFDHHLYKKARKAGVQFLLNTQVNDITFLDQVYQIKLKNSEIIKARLVIGAHGKRSKLDKTLERDFFVRRSGYIGVKYHIKTDFPIENIALHNFSGGYCGISRVEDGISNLCYLGQREHLRKYGGVKEMEKNILFENPFLDKIFHNSEFLFDQPIVINEFSFKKKKPVEKHIPMIGDAAGLITPLCGNGMALAIHSAKVVAEIIIRNYRSDKFNIAAINSEYSEQWKKLFARRLAIGRTVQNLFGSKAASNFAVTLIKNSPWVARRIIKNTHGQPIDD